MNKQKPRQDIKKYKYWKMGPIYVAFSEYLKFIFKSKAENFYFALDRHASQSNI